MSVTVRFAPSPTGHLHVGGARTALFNWLFARHHKGSFVLRIEDTDVKRSISELTDQILHSLSWLGLDWDKGPYFQSQRLELYSRYYQRLEQTGSLYRCFCSPERLHQLSQQARERGTSAVYDRHCLSLPQSEIDDRLTRGEPFTLRLRIPLEQHTGFTDLVYGDLSFHNAEIGDLMIRKSDGMPTYNFACVVDDLEMQVSHVIRGEDHISNTPKQLLILQALGEAPPQFAHLPLILGTDRKRLSKRHGATALDQFAREGYLPEAMMNFLALLGWAYDDKHEIFSGDELIRRFSLDRVSRAAAVFDYEKLDWLNGLYMRELPREPVCGNARQFLAHAGYPVDSYDPEWLAAIIELEIPRTRTLKELEEHLRFFLVDQVNYEPEAVKKFLTGEPVRELLKDVLRVVKEVEDFTPDTLEKELRQLAAERGIKLVKLAQPLRVALTGRAATPSLFDVIHLLGKERVCQRLRHSLKEVK